MGDILGDDDDFDGADALDDMDLDAAQADLDAAEAEDARSAEPDDVFDDGDAPAEPDDGDQDEGSEAEPEGDNAPPEKKSKNRRTARERIGGLIGKVSDLEARLEQAQQEREALQQRLAKGDAEGGAYRTQLHEANLSQVRSQKNAADAALKQARADYTAAFNNGDGDGVADAQDRIAQARIDISQLTAYEQYLTAQADLTKRAAERLKPPPQPPRPQVTPEQARAAAVAKTQIPAAQAFIATSPFLFKSPAIDRAAIHLSASLEDEGWDMTKPDAYREVHSRLHELYPDIVPKPRATKRPSRSPVGAPSRTSAGAAGNGYQFTKQDIADIAAAEGISANKVTKAHLTAWAPHFARSEGTR